MNRTYFRPLELFKVLLLTFLLSFFGGIKLYAQYYPVHATVQWPSPQSPYLSDYYSITRPLAKGLKVSAVLVKKAGKLLPEIRIEGKTILLYVEDKLHIRKFDAVTKKTINEPVDDSNLEQKIKEALSADMNGAASANLTRSLSSNKSFMDVLKGVRIKGKPIELEDLAKMFEDLHKAVPTNSVKPLKDVMDDFVYLVDHHLSDFMKSFWTDVKFRI